MTKASTSICVIAIAFAGAAGTCAARVVVRPSIPDTLDVPLNEALTLQARAAGYQIYACTAKPDSTHYEWTLEAPEADLFDSAGRKIGRHYAGPTWELADGSKVGGKVRAHANAPDGKALPWLLLDATANAGTGALARVASIQRINTAGGAAPAQACDRAHANAETRVPYSASYYFYAFNGEPLPWLLLGAN